MQSRLSNRYKGLALPDLFQRYPDLSIGPSEATELILRGSIDFRTRHPSCGDIEDSFLLEFRIQLTFPRALPVVRECADRIPATFHRFDDGELCLGSTLRLRLILGESPTLLTFVD